MIKNRIFDIIDKFEKIKIGVIGDLMLDQFTWGNAERLSPEAPIPIVFAESETIVPGGAGNTASNIAALGGQVQIIGVIGEDEAGKLLLQKLKHSRIDTSGIIMDQSRPTTQKIRIVARGQQVVRIDKEKRHAIAECESDRVIQLIAANINNWHGLAISNYAKGLITQSFAEKIVCLARERDKFIILDSKPEQIDYFKNATLVTPNLKEAEAISRQHNLSDMGKEIQKRLNCSVLITQGAEGMTLFENDQINHFPAEAEEVFDVSGAGDTVVATFAMALAAGAGMEEAAYIANHAAGIVVGKRGTATISIEELREKLNSVDYE